MDSDLDAEFLSSISALSKELDILGVDDKISTTSPFITCQSLLGTAWQLVQFIHCNSVATSEATFSREREYKLRDELQSAQTQLQKYKVKLEDKEKQVKSLELTLRKLRLDSLKWQETADSLTVKMKQVETKLERCHVFYKTEISAQAAECEKLRVHLRNKLGIARKLPTESLTDGLDSVSISENSNRQRREENKLHVVQQKALSLTINNQILVEENLLMRDTLARLHRQLDAVRLQGQSSLESLNVEYHPEHTDNKYEYPHHLFNLPISIVMEKLRTLGEDQIEALMNMFRLIVNKLPPIVC